MLVTGGYPGRDPPRSSTELLVENGSAWFYTGELSSPRYWLHGANIDRKVLMTGINRDNYDNEILRIFY